MERARWGAGEAEEIMLPPIHEMRRSLRLGGTRARSMSEGSQSTPPSTPPSNSDEWAGQPVNLTLLVELCEAHLRSVGVLGGDGKNAEEHELQQLWQLIAGGRIPCALERLASLAPGVCTHQPLLFEMKKQQLVELMRKGCVEEALAFSRDELAPHALYAFPDAYDSFKEAMLAMVLPPGAFAAPPAPPGARRRGGSSPADMADLMMPPLLMLSGGQPAPPVPTSRHVPVSPSAATGGAASAPAFPGATPTVQSCVEDLWSDERRQRLADSVDARVRLSKRCFGTKLQLLLKYAGLVSKKWLSVRRDWEVKKVFKLVGERKTLVDAISNETFDGPARTFDEAHVQALAQALSILRDHSVAALRRANGDVQEALLAELQRVALNAPLLRSQAQELLAAQGVAGAMLPDGPHRTAYQHLQRVRALLTEGDVQGCLALLEHECPNFAHNHKRTYFYLHIAHFGKLCDAGLDHEAVAVAQNVLGPHAAADAELMPVLKVAMRQLVAWLPQDAADDAAAIQWLSPARIEALIAPVCAAAASELGVPEPALLPMLRMMLWAHTKWFQFQQCEDIFGELVMVAPLKTPSFAAHTDGGDAGAADAQGSTSAVDDELSFLLGSSFRLAGSGSPSGSSTGSGSGSSVLGTTLGAPSMVRHMRAQTMAAPPMRYVPMYTPPPAPPVDESAVLTVMEFLAVPRADAINMLNETGGSVRGVIESYLG